MQLGACAAGLGLLWLITAYFLSYNTIQSTSRVLFILPVEQALDSRLFQVNFFSIKKAAGNDTAT